MADFNINGIQQVGVGTVDFRKSWNWFIEHFGFDTRILEDDTVAERMLRYTGNQPQKRHACIAMNLQGGGGLEIWQYSERKPEPCPFNVAIGDLGVFCTKVKCLDVKKFREVMAASCPDVGPVSLLPDGTPCFTMRDLYGNLFQLVERKDVYIHQGKLTGGVIGAMIGVTDMDKSLAFYKDILGYDKVIYDDTGIFSYWSGLPGSGEQYRRVMLVPSKPRKGAYSDLLGDDIIELVQALDHTPRKIYEGRYWGDPGFIQICYDVTGMKALKAFCASKGYPFTVDSCPTTAVSTWVTLPVISAMSRIPTAP
ncbi:MAG: VOC family protein [Bacteroidales bacterium]|nr:VOC family protein [Bacteroidales bacterium]